MVKGSLWREESKTFPFVKAPYTKFNQLCIVIVNFSSIQCNEQSACHLSLHLVYSPQVLSNAMGGKREGAISIKCDIYFF